MGPPQLQARGDKALVFDRLIVASAEQRGFLVQLRLKFQPRRLWMHTTYRVCIRTDRAPRTPSVFRRACVRGVGRSTPYRQTPCIICRACIGRAVVVRAHKRANFNVCQRAATDANCNCVVTPERPLPRSHRVVPLVRCLLRRERKRKMQIAAFIAATTAPVVQHVSGTRARRLHEKMLSPAPP